jgi:serine/threonine protein phosphatase PrpC
MPLYIDTGFSSARGAHHDDESCLMSVPRADEDMGHGAMILIADGIAERIAPESAAKDTLQAIHSHYYAAPENWGLKHILQESVAAANRALLTSGDKGRAAAFAAVVLRRRRWAIIYAGNTRVWLRRNNDLKLLTRDHVTPRAGRAPQVNRACGLDVRLDAEFLSGEIMEGDVFVLTNEAAHSNLTSPAILACARADVPVQQIAAMITEQATKAGGQGACACAIRVEQVPAESREDLEEDIAALPAINPPEVGESIDDFRIERLIHKSSRYRLYKAFDTQNQQIVALKFPNPRDANDPAFAENFLREEWISRRVTSKHLVRTLPLKKGRRTTLYSVMAYPSGENLAKKLARQTLSLDETTSIGAQLLDALKQLHEQGIIHNDVRPQNIVLDKRTGHLMLLGLDTTPAAASDEAAGNKRDSTSRRATFMAPELAAKGAECTPRSDIFSAGVVIYRMLTGEYPYGKSTGGRPPRGAYKPATDHRADIPRPIDEVLRQACAPTPADRFDSAQEFAEALDAAMARTFSSAAPTEPAQVVSRWRWELVVIGGMIAALMGYLLFAFRT